jgi:hypothetical protein
MYTGSAGLYYPYATHGRYWPDSTGPETDWALGWYGADGLYTYFYKSWCDMLALADVFTTTAQLALPLLRKLRYNYYVKIGRWQFYLKNLKVQYPIGTDAILSLVLKNK